MRGFSSCMKRQSNMFEPEYLHAKDCKISCNNRVKGYSKFRFGFCLTECYKSHPSRHLNLVSSRNSLSLTLHLCMNNIFSKSLLFLYV